jgi:hypothetical protein
VKAFLDGLAVHAKAKVYAALEMLATEGNRLQLPRSRALGAGLFANGADSGAGLGDREGTEAGVSDGAEPGETRRSAMAKRKTLMDDIHEELQGNQELNARFRRELTRLQLADQNPLGQDVDRAPD